MPKPFGSWVFFAALALATAAVTLRLNLLFTARVHPIRLRTHRSQLFSWIASAELALAALMLGSAVAVAEAHAVVAGILVSLAIVMIASLSVIEPATTDGAGLDRAPEDRSSRP
jgi:hypothetical protein